MTAIMPRWLRIEVWVEYDANTDGAAIDAVYDAVSGAAFEHEPPGCDTYVSSESNLPAPEWAQDENGSQADPP